MTDSTTGACSVSTVRGLNANRCLANRCAVTTSYSSDKEAARLSRCGAPWYVRRMMKPYCETPRTRMVPATIMNRRLKARGDPGGLS
jgi:hypothetical protein